MLDEKQYRYIGEVGDVTDGKRTRGVDARHDERRTEIVDALLRIIGEQGLDAVSVRDIAAEAGVSVGRVQHYFPTKDLVLQAAFERVNELGGERVRRHIAETGDSSPRAVLHAVSTAMLPVDDEHRKAIQIGVAFTARALVQPEFADRLRTGYGELHQLVALLLGRARDAGETAPDLDPEYEAAVLLGLLEGLSGQTLVGHHTVDAALSVVDTHLDHLFRR
jgi:TetR/AcrR family transcriptional regulator, transcriptional repressor of bet genes